MLVERFAQSTWWKPIAPTIASPATIAAWKPSFAADCLCALRTYSRRAPTPAAAVAATHGSHCARWSWLAATTRSSSSASCSWSRRRVQPSGSSVDGTMSVQARDEAAGALAVAGVRRIALDEPGLFTPGLQVEDDGEQCGRHEADRRACERPADGSQHHARVDRVAREAIRPAVCERTALARSRERRERVAERDSSVDEEPDSAGCDHAPDDLQRDPVAARPPRADRSAHSDADDDQGLQHDPALAAPSQLRNARHISL